VWLILPAYTPNMGAAFFGKGTPIDFGKILWDNRRILGDGKTYKGLFFGISCGILTGFFQMIAIDSNLHILFNLPLFGIDLINSLIVISSLAIGSLFGDIFMSFFKRRVGLKRGAAFPLIDQLDFVFGAWILTYLTHPTWFIENFTMNVIIAILIITPILHIVTNMVGYLIGIKKEPW
jgi:CDP-2,3-bis-(O-geranylgeranyl)-sn-glycerol synthase